MLMKFNCDRNCEDLSVSGGAMREVGISSSFSMDRCRANSSAKMSIHCKAVSCLRACDKLVSVIGLVKVLLV